jgi:hypothetical protein
MFARATILPFTERIFVDLDPLSLLTRLCASVPPPRSHTTRYAGVLFLGEQATTERARTSLVDDFVRP